MSVSCRAEVVSAVKEICGIDAAALTDDADLEALGIDSLDLIEISAIIEESHDLLVEADAFEDVSTFGAAVAGFDRLIAADSPAPDR